MGTFNYDDEFPNYSKSSNANNHINSIELSILYIDIKKIEIAESTLKRYESMIRSLAQFVNYKKPVSSYSQEDLLRIRNSLLTSPQLPNQYRPVNEVGRSVATVNNYMQMLLSLFKFAFSNKYISEDLTINFSYLKKERPTPDPLSEDELSILVSCCPNAQARNMLILSVYKGLRPGELTGLAPEVISDQTYLCMLDVIRRSEPCVHCSTNGTCLFKDGS